jgi:hypothetical protein
VAKKLLTAHAKWIGRYGKGYGLLRRTAAGEVRIEVRTLIAIMIMVLMATSSAFARKSSQQHSKRAAPNHHSTIETDPGGVARDPADVELDRKIGSICRGC